MNESAAAQLYRSANVEHVDVGSATLAFRRFGAGPPLLFIHGWPLSGFTWRKLLPSLSRRFTCFTVDLAGAGDSDWKDTNDFSFHGHAAHLQEAARALGLDRYALIAHDTGATVARRLAEIEGDRVSGVVAIDTEIPHHRPPLVPFFQKVLALPGSGFVFRKLLGSKRFVRSSAGFGGCFHDLSHVDGEFEDEFVTPLRASARRMEGQIRYARGIDWKQLDGLAEGHGKITAPVLFVWGDGDPFFPIERAKEMMTQVKDCRGFVTIPRAKLLPHEEHPDAVLAHVEEFLASLPASRDLREARTTA